MDLIILKPIITEKSMKETSSGLYTFAVAKNSDKLSVAKAVTEKFSVKVLSVKIINVKGKTKTQRKVRGTYQTSGYKKAIVQIGKGEKIGIFETDSQKQAEVTTAGEIEPIKEKKNMLRGTKVKIEKIDVPMQTTQRKVITGK